MTAKQRIYRDQINYHRLCDEARALGVPTSLDDPRTTRTVWGLRMHVATAKARQAQS
jgi:hypothetical protein